MKLSDEKTANYAENFPCREKYTFPSWDTLTICNLVCLAEVGVNSKDNLGVTQQP